MHTRYRSGDGRAVYEQRNGVLMPLRCEQQVGASRSPGPDPQTESMDRRKQDIVEGRSALCDEVLKNASSWNVVYAEPSNASGTQTRCLLDASTVQSPKIPRDEILPIAHPQSRYETNTPPPSAADKAHPPHSHPSPTHPTAVI